MTSDPGDTPAPARVRKARNTCCGSQHGDTTLRCCAVPLPPSATVATAGATGGRAAPAAHLGGACTGRAGRRHCCRVWRVGYPPHMHAA